MLPVIRALATVASRLLTVVSRTMPSTASSVALFAVTVSTSAVSRLASALFVSRTSFPAMSVTSPVFSALIVVTRISAAAPTAVSVMSLASLSVSDCTSVAVIVPSATTVIEPLAVSRSVSVMALVSSMSMLPAALVEASRLVINVSRSIEPAASIVSSPALTLVAPAFASVMFPPAVRKTFRVPLLTMLTATLSVSLIRIRLLVVFAAFRVVTVVSIASALPIPLVAVKLAVPAVKLTAAALASVIAPPAAVMETLRLPLLTAPMEMSTPAATSAKVMADVSVLVASNCATAVRSATPSNVFASPELAPMPSLAEACRRLVVIVAVATAAEFVIEPRSPSATAAVSLSAARTTVWLRTPSVVSMAPELATAPKMMSSPAVNVKVASAAAPLSDTTALLLMVRSSFAAFESPAVNAVEALTFTFALIVSGLIARITPPPEIVAARPSASRSVSVRAPVFVRFSDPIISASSD